jgi:hypothetical protein
MAFAAVGKEGINEDGTINYDEFEEIRASRYLTANEAYLSILGYPLVHKCNQVNFTNFNK